ncbi:hypothetical protein FRACYDRAFT_239741 [Fragilariopsis cylindrus CCMP1102]|uniref:Uncharacterized protein n=1 Tax=Fragilariopsis cylindrus CCMP1102 TaxID=635003 RepID=A0A1E7FA94_9STRA|nr:hypothetical protein FRACYDRAFT_239741 [Fragilariopsis cylindrus CCMP1102]|eukprot:OEU15059.1 hypothetical protein FRACYDRAFT_239741 [Fragilariopsis cylindrus CCMP1102]
MSWTQVYVTGLSKSINPSDMEIENILNTRYDLTILNTRYDLTDDDNNVMWAGFESTLIKRDFFHSFQKRELLLFPSPSNSSGDIINNNFPLQQLKAELSNPKGAKDKNKNNKGTTKSQDLPDLRLRSKRKKPVRKHPVIISSDKTKTNQGNKTK